MRTQRVRREGRGSGRRPPAVGILSVLALLGGCTGADGEVGYSVRDSSGVTIVENASGTWSADDGWRIAVEPRVDIGMLDGEEPYQLFQVSGAVRLADGRIVVANGGSRELRYFDARGRYLKSAGRKGGGPGEFEGVGAPVVVGTDTIAVYDWNLRRISLWDPAGDFVRSFGIQFPSGSPVAVGPLDDGMWLFTKGFAFRPSEISTVVRDTAAYFRFDRQGELVDSMGRFPSWEFYVQGSNQVAWATSLPFGRGFATAVAPAGFYHGITDRYEIMRYAASGQLERVIRKQHRPVTVGDGDVERYKAERFENADSDNWRRRLERMFAEIPMPSTFPAFQTFEVDALGYLWVAEFERPGAEVQRWSVFDGEGRLLGSVETPSGLQVHQIGTDFVLASWRDDLGVEHVRLYDLVRDGG
ncbi:MAG: hypothetical protein JSW43_01150 [Gemmatimonadota bacterium]|nr:MAG: hypothetical protein JSW43_01150 [Gemmatimonadota bacterium]